MPDEFNERCREIAKRFLLTAVVVDDQPYFESAVTPGLMPPGRRDHVATDEREEGTRDSHSLSATALTTSFVEQGLICGVIQPGRDADTPNLPAVVKRADVVVVDWRLNGDDGGRALELLKWILGDDASERLRLIAVYTGEPDIRGVGARIVGELMSAGRAFERAAGLDDDLVLSIGSCLIVIYAKPGTILLEPGLRTRSVSEHDLAARLIGDFTSMVEGLLPSIALTGLTAVRENAHKVLRSFETNLDPAFLTHRACLRSPADSEQHMVAQLASELHGIMDEAVAKESPAGVVAIERWLAKFKRHGIEFAPEKSINSQQAMVLLTDGLDKANGPLRKSRGHEIMTSGFARPDDGPAHGLDSRLASMMCFRTVFDRTLKRLWMGTAVRQQVESGDYRHLLCMRPRCDSVRMTKPESFLFVPLSCHTPNTLQIVAPVGRDTESHARLSVDTNMSEWVMVDFEPDDDAESVVTRVDGTVSYFLGTDDARYEWIGELKLELAQSLAQSLASSLSGVALDRSEWLRRSERLG